MRVSQGLFYQIEIGAQQSINFHVVWGSIKVADRNVSKAG